MPEGLSPIEVGAAVIEFDSPPWLRLRFWLFVVVFALGSKGPPGPPEEGPPRFFVTVRSTADDRQLLRKGPFTDVDARTFSRDLAGDVESRGLDEAIRIRRN